MSSDTGVAVRAQLDDRLPAVGVFVDAPVEAVAALLKRGTIQVAQLHGHEDDDYITALRQMASAPVWKAFRVREKKDISRAADSSADLILLDNGYGTGETFDWSLLEGVHRPYILAGGLCPGNVETALRTFHPFGVDVSSGIETDGQKDEEKIRAFLKTVRSFPEAAL